MKPESLTELSNQELLQQIKRIKTNLIIDAAIVGSTIGVVIYSAVQNGSDFSLSFHYYWSISSLEIRKIIKYWKKRSERKYNHETYNNKIGITFS